MANQVCPECESGTPGPRSETCTNKFHQPDVVRQRHEFVGGTGLDIDYCIAPARDSLRAHCGMSRSAECHVVEPHPLQEFINSQVDLDPVAEKALNDVVRETTAADDPYYGQPSNAAQDAKAEYDKWFPDPIPTTTASSADLVLSQPDAAQKECPEDCAFCSGEACELCGAGCWSNVTNCPHDVAKRHAVKIARSDAAQESVPERIWIDATCHAQDVVAKRAGAYFFTPNLGDADCVEYVQSAIANAEVERLQMNYDLARAQAEESRKQLESLKAAGIDRALEIVKAKRDEWQAEYDRFTEPDERKIYYARAADELIAAATALAEAAVPVSEAAEIKPSRVQEARERMARGVRVFRPDIVGDLCNAIDALREAERRIRAAAAPSVSQQSIESVLANLRERYCGISTRSES